MRKFLPIGLLALMALINFSAFATPAKKGIRTFTQADGTTISLNLVGDEHFHSYETTDGMAVSRGSDGNFYYRTANGISTVVAHNVNARSASENEFVKANVRDMDIASIVKALKAGNKMRQAPQRAMRRASQVPSIGSPKVPIILVQYKDYSFKDSDPNATFVNFFNSGSTSAFQYFKDQSNGKYTPEYDIYGPVTLSKNRSYYGGNDSYGYDKYVGTMVGEACLLINSQMDFSQYDNDNDGECDVVIVIYAGDGEASSYDDDAEDAVWPCQWSLSSSDYGKSLTLDGTKVDKFAVFNELNGSDLSKIDGIGTFCHEFSHCLDLPDFYDTNYGAHFGMGPWSLMDYGSYNNDGYTPIGYSAYEKAFMGWINIEEGQQNTQYTLPVFNQKNADTDVAVKLTNSKDANEYYIFENRAQQGWDAYMPYKGMMITHVTYSASAWTGNTVNDYDLQRMTIIPADNNLKLDSQTYYGTTYYTFNEADLAGDLWPYGNATELTDTSTPAAKVNTGSYMGKPVTEITKNANGTISFWVMKAQNPAVATPTGLSHKVESESSATISWTPGDNNDVTYTVEVSKHKDVNYELVSSTTFTPNSHNWTEDGSVNSSNGELYIGSSKKTGSLTSPSFTTDETAQVTVIFKAKSYGSDNSSVVVSLINAAGSTVDTKTVALTTDYATYTVVFDCTANISANIKFENTASKKRVYMQSADIYRGDASSITSEAPARAASDTQTLTGITGTSVLVSNLVENETYDYRVKAVPTDTNSYSDSPWSDKATFTLTTNGVLTIDTDNDATAEYFTIQGVRINGIPTTPGIYIRRQGSKTVKILVK